MQNMSNTDLFNHSFLNYYRPSSYIHSKQRMPKKENPIIIINRTNITEAMPTSIYIKISIT